MQELSRRPSRTVRSRGSALVRRAGLIAAIAGLPLVVADVASAQAPYAILAFTKNATVGSAEGVAALQAAAPPGATVEASSDASKFTQAGLAAYKAVVFLNTSGDVLDDTQQAAFEAYIKG